MAAKRTMSTSRARRTRRWKIPLALSLRARRSKPSAARDAIDEVSVVLLALAKRYPSKRESFLALFLFFSPFSRKKKFPLFVRKPAQADALAAKGRAKAQRCDILAKNALFIEYVGRCEAPGLAVGGGTNDLKRRSDSLEARNTELDDECSGLSTQIDEQEAMFTLGGNSVMTKGELTARRNTTEFFEKRRRHTLLTKSPSFFEAKALAPVGGSCG